MMMMIDNNNNKPDTVCAQVHFNICKEIGKLGVQFDNEHWYKRTSQ